MSENARWISYMKSGIARRKMINRNLLKERQKDDAMYEGKEKFVTSDAVTEDLAVMKKYEQTESVQES